MNSDFTHSQWYGFKFGFNKNKQIYNSETFKI